MPRPQTGQFLEPGSSSPDYVPALTESSLPEQLDQLARDARQREQANAERALAALSGTDPLLFPISSKVRPAVAAILKAYQTKLAAFRASPERRDLTREAITRREQAIAAAERDAAFANLEAEVGEKLAAVTAKLEQSHAALAGKTITQEEANEAHLMADRLRHLTPDLGLPELVEFVDQVGVGERPRGELVALLPVLESAYRTPGSPWTGRDELRRLVAIGESLCDGGWKVSTIEARLERAQRLSGEIATFFYVAKTDPVTLTAHVTSGVDERAGEFALLPDELPPDGPPAEDYEPYQAPTTRVRRGATSPAQRAVDQHTRANQADE